MKRKTKHGPKHETWRGASRCQGGTWRRWAKQKQPKHKAAARCPDNGVGCQRLLRKAEMGEGGWGAEQRWVRRSALCRQRSKRGATFLLGPLSTQGGAVVSQKKTRCHHLKLYHVFREAFQALVQLKLLWSVVPNLGISSGIKQKKMTAPPYPQVHIEGDNE